MRLWQRLSVRSRLAVLASTAMALMCSAASVAVLFTVHETAQTYTTQAVVNTAERLGYASIHEPLPPVMPDEAIAGIQVIDRSGRITSTTASIAGRPRMTEVRPAKPGSQVIPRECRSPAFPDGCVTIAAFRVPDEANGHIVYAADHDVPWHVDGRLLATLICVTLALTALTAFGTYQTVRRALAPVDAITERLAAITATDLSLRVPVSKFQDELRRLAEAANQTLDRAEHAVERQWRFASDVSHDLRSPLTAMRAEIEEAMLDPEHADWPATGEALLDSLDRMQAMVADLLHLAKLDAGAARPKTERIDLAGLAASELDRRPRKVEVVRDLRPGVIVTGDRLNLARLLGNLLDNGERHAESTLWVTVRAENGEAVLEVLDDGPGIPPECREVVFQRFVRLDQARQKDSGGTGLGLSIARQIAQAHNGTLTVEDSAAGARFVLRLPAASP